ncbi:MAG: hypothetical protein ACTHM6_19490, partial [Tepidisphaeraceae bacterium]
MRFLTSAFDLFVCRDACSARANVDRRRKFLGDCRATGQDPIPIRFSIVFDARRCAPTEFGLDGITLADENSDSLVPP